MLVGNLELLNWHHRFKLSPILWFSMYIPHPSKAFNLLLVIILEECDT